MPEYSQSTSQTLSPVSSRFRPVGSQWQGFWTRRDARRAHLPIACIVSDRVSLGVGRRMLQAAEAPHVGIDRLERAKSPRKVMSALVQSSKRNRPALEARLRFHECAPAGAAPHPR